MSEQASTEQKDAAETAPPAAEPRDSFAGALKLFYRLVNVNFCNNNRDHLQRWASEYSDEFIALAWKIARTGKMAHVPTAAFVWLLDGTKPWPDELRQQFQRDQQAASKSGAEGAAHMPQVGEIRVRTDDGRSGRVIDVDTAAERLTLQFGADPSESWWLPWGVTKPALSVARGAVDSGSEEKKSERQQEARTA